MPLGDKAKAALPLRAATLKQQAMITRHSGKRQVSLKPALEFKADLFVFISMLFFMLNPNMAMKIPNLEVFKFKYSCMEKVNEHQGVLGSQLTRF